jgi:hypothetical protein
MLPFNVNTVYSSHKTHWQCRTINSYVMRPLSFISRTKLNVSWESMLGITCVTANRHTSQRTAAQSVGCRFLPFRDEILPSSSRVQCTRRGFWTFRRVWGVRKAYGGNVQSEFMLEERRGRNSSCCGGSVWKPSSLLQGRVLICSQLIRSECYSQLFEKGSAHKGYKSELLVCWLICLWFRWLVDLLDGRIFGGCSSSLGWSVGLFGFLVSWFGWSVNLPKPGGFFTYRQV